MGGRKGEKGEGVTGGEEIREGCDCSQPCENCGCSEEAIEQEQGKEEIEKEKEEINPWEDKYIRLMADFQNHKKRTEKEKADIYSYANEKIALELLEVSDNFERALEHTSEDAKGIFEGMVKIYKQLKEVLEKNGVTEIEALGNKFDPGLHDAVMMEESEEAESGTITMVIKKGYMLKDKVLRHAMVKVAG